MARPVVLIALALALAAGLWFALGGERAATPGLAQDARTVERSNDGAQDRLADASSSTSPQRSAIDDPASEDSGESDARRELIEERDRRIRGVVVDESDLPLAGVEIVASLDRWSGYERWHSEDAPADSVDTATTDASGAFTIDPGGERLVEVEARSADHPVHRVSACAPGARLRIVLARGACVEGLVTEAGTAAPVKDAEVRVHHGADGDEIAIVRTDAAGRYRADGLLPGEGGVLVVPLEHAMARWQPTDLEPGATLRVDVEVARGWSLGGRVRDAETGDPIAGARVSPWEFVGQIVRTDARGVYRVDGVRERPGTLSFDAPGYGRTELRFETEREDLDVRLRRALTVTGRAVDESGAPVAGALCTLAALENEGMLARREWRTARTSADGRFEIADARADVALTLQVRAAGFGAALVRVPTAEPGGVADVGDVRLVPQAVLAGRVVRGDGSPVAGAAVGLEGPKGQELDGSVSFHFGRISATTDESGAFYVPGLAAGAWSLGAFETAGRAVGIEVTLAPGEQRLDVVLQLPSGLPVRGRVVDAEGRGVARAFVMLFPEDEQRGPLQADQCDEAGAFEIADVPDGPFTARVTGPEPDEDGGAVPLYVPTVARGLTPDGALLELVLERLDARVEGRVVDADGEPVESAYVCVALDGADLPWNGVLTDADGAFELNVRSGGPTELIAWRTRDMDDSGNLTGTEWQIGRRLEDPEVPNGRATVEAGATSVVLRCGTR